MYCCLVAFSLHSVLPCRFLSLWLATLCISTSLLPSVLSTSKILPSYWPSSVLLNQSEGQIFTAYQKVVDACGWVSSRPYRNRKQWKGMLAQWLTLFPSFIQSRAPDHRRWGPHLGWVFPPQLILSGSALSGPELCLLGNSTPGLVNNEDNHHRYV